MATECQTKDYVMVSGIAWGGGAHEMNVLLGQTHIYGHMCCLPNRV